MSTDVLDPMLLEDEEVEEGAAFPGDVDDDDELDVPKELTEDDAEDGM